MTGSKPSPQAYTPLPAWLKRPHGFRGDYRKVRSAVENSGLHTVCSEARCPNRGECFARGTATFLIMGDTCTRHCSFCGVNHGIPAPPHPTEPERVAETARDLDLHHIVITSVTRDDLPDGGAAHFAACIMQCRALLPATTIEVLIPDFKGNFVALDMVLSAKPSILNHNLETVPRLYPAVRPESEFRRSLDLLAHARQKGFTTKSGIMVGLGENEEEVVEVLESLRSVDCRIVTIGQYLRPSKEQTAVKEFIHPDQFAKYERIGLSLGFDAVFSGPFVRSSYRAEEIKKRVSLDPSVGSGQRVAREPKSEG
jgi:lipoyl synthase